MYARPMPVGKDSGDEAQPLPGLKWCGLSGLGQGCGNDVLVWVEVDQAQREVEVGVGTECTGWIGSTELKMIQKWPSGMEADGCPEA